MQRDSDDPPTSSRRLAGGSPVFYPRVLSATLLEARGKVLNTTEEKRGSKKNPTQITKKTTKKFDRRRGRTCNLLIRSQAPCHWASRPDC
ncbi:hypothetical protein N7532_003318 [Penicillium argentinense]|uniref:Uncharacterized protein n=1 Tax=Penicillium argentinense TaxID=1131581 RepID=A0A9W9FM59_9EURO|nr:uncharacterized protein N7532_003318 [Penicillium argentinense]KAJ5102789.1 hypothetical protein N7532_003318 [Penicillium argentinense]